jgi:hypothetical protein
MKIPMKFFAKLGGKKVLKSIWKHKRPLIVKESRTKSKPGPGVAYTYNPSYL